MKCIGIVISFLICLGIEAQTFTFGPKGGINFASSNFNHRIAASDTVFHLQTQDAKFGLDGGVFFRFKVKKFYVQPEVLVSQQRSSFSVTSNYDTIGESKEIQYLKYDFPLNIGVKFGRTFRLNGGIVGSYIFSSFIKNLKNSAIYAVNLHSNNTQWAYQLGLGFDIRKTVTIDIKYEGNIAEHNATIDVSSVTSPFRTRSNNVQLNFGIALIPFKK